MRRSITSINSVAVSRLIISIQSLAAGLQVDPTWLLSHSELSRVNWRRGSHEGELIVEVNPVEAHSMGKIQLETAGDNSSTSDSDSDHTRNNGKPLVSPRIYATVFGQHDNLMANQA